MLRPQNCTQLFSFTFVYLCSTMNNRPAESLDWLTQNKTTTATNLLVTVTKQQQQQQQQQQSMLNTWKCQPLTHWVTNRCTCTRPSLKSICWLLSGWNCWSSYCTGETDVWEARIGTVANSCSCHDTHDICWRCSWHMRVDYCNASLHCVTLMFVVVATCNASDPACELIWNTFLPQLHRDLIAGTLSRDELQSFCRFWSLHDDP